MEMATISEKSVSASIEAYTSGKEQTAEIRAWSEEIRQLQDDASELAIDSRNYFKNNEGNDQDER
jgi:hypothetical protein